LNTPSPTPPSGASCLARQGATAAPTYTLCECWQIRGGAQSHLRFDVHLLPHRDLNVSDVWRPLARASDALRPLGRGLAEGGFPSLQRLVLHRTHGCLKELANALAKRAPGRATLRRVELGVSPEDLGHLPRMAQVLVSLPGLEHVKFYGSTAVGELPRWCVEGGREAVVELSRVLEGLDRSGWVAFKDSIRSVLADRYTGRRR
jgi:hypothetical protein